MPKIDPRVDAYIAKSADFGKPILKRIRAAVHMAAGNGTGNGRRAERATRRS